MGVHSCAASTTGYSPFLHFDVDDMDTTIVRCLSLGATLDGPIKYPAHGKVCTSPSIACEPPVHSVCPQRWRPYSAR